MNVSTLLMNNQLQARVFVRLYYIKCTKVKTTTLLVGTIDNKMYIDRHYYSSCGHHWQHEATSEYQLHGASGTTCSLMWFCSYPSCRPSVPRE